MKLNHAEIVNFMQDTDEQLIARLLAAHQAIKDINTELKYDTRIKELQDELAELKEFYKKRILRQRNIIAGAELLAKAKNLILTEDKLD